MKEILFELEVTVTLTATRMPLTPAELGAHIRPTLGFRYRF